MKKTFVFIGIVLLAFVVASTALALIARYDISVTADSTEIIVGKTAKINYTYTYENPPDTNTTKYHAPTSPTVKYSSSDSAVATVDASGTVTGVSPGSATITVTLTFSESFFQYDQNLCNNCEGTTKSQLGDATREIVINVVPEAAFTMSDITLYQSGSGILSVIYPEDYTGSKNGTWSVADPAVASVDQSGCVTGKQPGETTASFLLAGSNKGAICHVIVEPLLTLGPSLLDICAGMTVTVEAVYHPQYTGDIAGTWSSSDADLVAVDAGGNVSALQNASGTATIRYTNTSTGITGEVAVSVRPLFKFKLPSLGGIVGSSLRMGQSPSFDPAYTGARDGIWTTADGSIAAIDQRGVIIPVKAGTTTATFTHAATGLRESFTVKIYNPTFSITPDPLTLIRGQTGQLTAAFESAIIADQNGTWAVADEAVATVDQNGAVTAKQAGTTTVTFTHTASGALKRGTVVVTSPRFTVAPDPQTVEQGRTGSFIVTFEKDYTGQKSGTWSVADGNVASVDQNGVVTGLAPGATTATFTLNADNSSATAAVIVTEPAQCTVTFDTNGGNSAPDTVTVDKNSIIKEPPAPARSGYLFTGWYIQIGPGLRWDFSTNIVTEDMTLYAGWAEIPYIPVDPGPVNSAPTIIGPDTISLLVGYGSTSQAYTVSGAPVPSFDIDPAQPNTAGASFAGTTLTIPASLGEGTYYVTLTATNSEGTATKTVTVRVYPTIILLYSYFNNVLLAYSTTCKLEATGGAGGAYTFTMIDPLPAGLTLDSDTGQISYSSLPAAGMYYVNVQVKDAAENQATFTMTFNIS